MKAIVYHDTGDIRLDDVPEPTLQHSTDAIIRLTATAICGTDLHFLHSTIGGMEEGTILGHEGVGIVEALGGDVRNLQVGDRVVVCSTIACGNCSYCRAGYYSQCDTANPNGREAGTAMYGGPQHTGPFNGLQAEKARIPFANVGLVKLPRSISDDEAVLLSDILPSAYFGAEMAEITDGDTVAVFGCGPVGLFAIACAKLMGASRVLAVDHIDDRLAMAQAQGAEIINFDRENPVEAIRRLTGGIGVDRAIDAVGVDAEQASRTESPSGTADSESGDTERRGADAGGNGNDRYNGSRDWRPGDSPAQALDWAVQALAKAGTLSITGSYPQEARSFPIGLAMNKNLTMKMGNCPHRKYVPKLIELILSGRLDPADILTRSQRMEDALEAFRTFDQRESGWIKVSLVPSTDPTANTDSQLDEAIEESFPASDPPSLP